MTAAVEPAFLDTNVLVYAYEREVQAKNVIARSLLRNLMAAQALRLSVQVLQELYVTLTRKGRPPLGAAEAAERIAHLALWPVQILDYSLVSEAMRLSQDSQVSYWDALIVAAAARSGARRLYTEDLNRGQVLLGVEVVNPFAA